MSKCFPPSSKNLSKYAPLIHVMKVKPEKVNLRIGSGGKKVGSIIEETSVESIEAQDNGTVKITAKSLASLEKSKTIISNLTMVPNIGDIFRNCEIKSVAPYGVFVEITPGREGLCHISEFSANWLAKAEDAFKVGDHVDVKLIEVNEKGQLRLIHKALLPDPNPEKQSIKQRSDISVKESTDSPKTQEKGKRKNTSLSSKNDVDIGVGELPEDKIPAIEVTIPAETTAAEFITLRDDNIVNRIGSLDKDEAQSDKKKKV